ncbi:MAG: hypothetical protein COB78_03795 [Hyphomicrobiales bacterium]|nr:MAG: hypothetical protein COB78_03795 [Hyphomicrobiales bacterium]
MTIISVQSHYGGAATFGIGRGFSSHSIPAGRSSNAGVIPSVSAFGGQSSGASGAIGKIMDIIAGMEKSGSNKVASSAYRVSENEQRSIDKLNTITDIANWTKDDLVEYITTDEYAEGRAKLDIKNDRYFGMREALLNGTATVVDMEELGFRTEASLNLHFNSDGHYIGSSMDLQTSGADREEFFGGNGTMVRHDDGTVTDRETGLNASHVIMGGVELYITYP